MVDFFYSVAGSSQAQLKVCGSCFLAIVVGIREEQEADELVTQVRKQFHDAAHYYFAYWVGAEGRFQRTNDDGEPAGTAGLPILRQIEARRTTNTLVFVTRYYGGTKLGRGGLCRAYAEAAANVLDLAEIVAPYIQPSYEVVVDYDDSAREMNLIAQAGAEVVAREYSDRTWLEVNIRKLLVRKFELGFVESLGGRGMIRQIVEQS